MYTEKKKHFFLLVIGAVFFVWAFIKPYDYLTLSLELIPIFLGLIVLAATYRRFPLTTFVYGLIVFEIIITLIGGHFSYAKVPGFSWLQEIGFFERNNYDKLGHFFLGFCPAIIIREVLLRTTPLQKGMFFSVIVAGITIAISAINEIFEYAAFITIGDLADDFLGMQGFIWDTQTDMAWALIGAITALALLSGAHDNALQKLQHHLRSPTTA